MTDGASNTILVGEKHLNLSFCTTAAEPDDNDGYCASFEDDVVRWGWCQLEWFAAGAG